MIPLLGIDGLRKFGPGLHSGLAFARNQIDETDSVDPMDL